MELKAIRENGKRGKVCRPSILYRGSGKDMEDGEA